MASNITFVLDGSGSMADAYDETLTGFNEYREELLKLNEDIIFTLIVFNSTPTIIYDAVPLAETEPLTAKVYKTEGMTALYDTLGLAITRMEKQKVKRGTKQLLTILTDGRENVSKEYSKDAIKALIKKHKKWIVTYMSADINAFSDAAGIGISRGNTARYSAAPSMRGRTFTAMAMSTGCVLVGEVGPESVYASVGDSLLTPEDKTGMLEADVKTTAKTPLWNTRYNSNGVQSINLKEATEKIKVKRGR